jgi:hypothetical protein
MIQQANIGGQTLSRSLLPRILTSCLAIGLTSASCHAQLFYDFVEDNTGDVLATIELFQLPASVNDFVGLTFTPEGQAIFGFGPEYLGTFDRSTGPGNAVVSDGGSGLVGDGGLVSWVDDDPPPSDLGLTSSVIVDFYAIGFIPKVKVEVIVAESEPVAAEGHWVVVPEPSSLVLIILAAVLVSGLEVCQRNRCA